MNKVLKFLSLLFITTVYFTAIGYTQEEQSFSNKLRKPNSALKEYKQKLSSKGLQHTTESENLTNHFNNLPSTNVKNTFSEAGINFKSVELFFNRKYIQYISLSRNTIVNYRKSDLIFPFHYHW
ncbi:MULTISPECIES: hypothetical protein [Tenacibaculum]|uniref:Uncharacterized protein n=2 Tax=Tenacibaculum TaxID=104267 RepID=A0AAE9MM56_9FLAO|nr:MULTISPECIES: hypothetical protein [Tenacibaculum]GFD76282.1 hypothetical protein KUL113_57020 [Tenacibaculum sp. KUL113]GFD92796.1 hypothetical protein KUL154_15290 [Alteromonas sp. KUL154]GFE02688.1 hypothetical protein KUL156_52800 [Alteromonas sp. KUL156]AZJ31936.1 hypothetical protein D6200_04885 [Tenacibaculum mesophilum]KAF9658042.1 hypothetical protein HBA12_12595 [Tenacibaculum mesophilum]